MNLEEEKKLVAEKLNISFMITPIIRAPIEEWNPQSERKWWDEIWDKMDKKTMKKYLNTIFDIHAGPSEQENPDHTGVLFKCFHTAKPETCWKALIKTLTEMGAV